MANAAAAPAAAIKEPSLFWPSIATLEVAFAEAEVVPVAVLDPEVDEAAVCAMVELPVELPVELLVELPVVSEPVAVVELEVVSVAVDEPLVPLSQTTLSGMSVTPPVLQISFATSMVSVDDEFQVLHYYSRQYILFWSA